MKLRAKLDELKLKYEPEEITEVPVLKKRQEMLSLDITTPENEYASGAIGEGTSRFLPQKETQSCSNQAEGDLQLEKSVSTNTPVAPLPPHKNLPVNVQLEKGYLIQATNETNVNIPQMADTLFERATNSSWVVVFKALVTTHHLMVHGNEVHPNELTNGVINAAFMLLFKDLIKLFACYNDGVINLLEKFFEMKKGQCKDALEIYKRFLTRMTRVSEFLKVAEQVGIDKGDIPDLTQSSPATTVTSPNSTPAKTIDTSPPVDLFATASAAVPVSASKPSSDLLDLQPDFAGAAAAAAPAPPPPAGGATAWGDSLAALSSVPTEAQISDPFAPEPTPPTTTAEIATASASASTTTTVTAVTADVDLFGDLFESAPEVAAAPKPDAAPSIDLFGTGFGGSFMAPSPSPVTPAQNNLLQPNFEAAFGTTPSTSSSSSFDPSVFDGLGDLLMPTMAPAGQPAPVSMVPPSPAMAASKALGSDLDSSLASLVGNLGISGTTSKKGDLQWNAGEKKLTGGANWQPKVTPATWSAGVPSSAPLQGAVPPTSSVPPVAGAPSVGQPGAGFGMPPAGTGMPMMPQQPVMFAQPMMRPPFGATAVPGTQLSPSPTPASQSPKKPPAKDPLADLNIKDFL
ncbi:Clathrin coat assembly protein AP180 [Sciurus carolinensis]|uniref:Clathrin coat assembly protein AP180 n=1 Tax=Sciurus carolinensis TaxID=30640 RepID=A0AA41T4T3_SCICA|nr:Clathrin coat assembly protein AP180 [Sciurus carolinensis]